MSLPGFVLLLILLVVVLAAVALGWLPLPGGAAGASAATVGLLAPGLPGRGAHRSATTMGRSAADGHGTRTGVE